MTGSRTLTLLALTCLAAGPAAAQQPAVRSPLARADVHGTLGWFNAEAAVSNPHNDWYNNSLYGGAGFGWYWTDHHKTEVEFGATSTAELYANEPLTISGQTTYLSFQQKFSTKRIGVAQQYQFYRNAWFHPHVAAGVDLTWQTVRRQDEQVYSFDPLTRQPRIARDRQDHGPVTSRNARAFATTGFKAYLTPRGFFRTDLRVSLHDGIDEVLLRFGFGLDF
jgi:hypothetical protein